MAKFVTFKPVESEKLNKSEPVLKYKLLTSKAYPPTRETTGSIGYDLRSPRFARIPPKGGTYYLPLGIAFQIPEGHYGRLAPKSGLAIYRSIGVLAGVIDQDYTGEVFVLLINHDDKLSYQIRPEDKIVQLILEKATIARLQEVCRGITRIHRLPSRRSHPYGRQPHSLIFMSTLYKATSCLPASS